MFEPEDIDLTTSRGQRPSSTAGDRMMVGLAALALVGGGLIAIGKVLPSSDPSQAAEVTATPQPTEASAPSVTPRPTPTARPLRSFQLATGSAPAVWREDYSINHWVRALEDVPIWTNTTDGALKMGVIRAGEAALVIEPPRDLDIDAWYQVEAPLSGWVRREIRGRTVFKVERHFQLGTGWLDRLVAGPDGFAALGLVPSGQNDYRPLVAGSSDGRRWAVSTFGGSSQFFGLSVAHGPAGWLGVQLVQEGPGGSPKPWVWRSDDLAEWELLGSMDGLIGSGPGQLVGTDAGYVMATVSGGYGSGSVSLWFSSDGLLWSERLSPGIASDGSELNLTGTSLGFYAHGSRADGSAIAAYSVDGWSWTDVVDDFDQLIGVAAAGEALIAIDRTPLGVARTWRGTIAGERLTWAPDDDGDGALEGAALTGVVSDGTTTMAFGWERATQAPQWWIRTGSDWQQGSFPEAYQGIPRVAAAGPAGIVVAGGTSSLFGLDPLIWHYDGATWQPQQGTVIEPVRGPTQEECAAVEADIIDLMNGGSLIRTACFGDAPLTIRGWVLSCQDCYYYGQGRGRPAWLMQPRQERILLLSPLETDAGWGTLDAVLARSLRRHPGWTGRLVEVTGHFDDPAAASCQWFPPPPDEQWFGGRQDSVNQCRGRFVVTSVQPVGDSE